MAEEIALAQEEQELLQGENLEQEQLESEEGQEIENSENVETQDKLSEEKSKDDKSKDRDPQKGLKDRINTLTARNHNKNDVIKEQERMLEFYETKFGKLKEVDESTLNDDEKLSHNIQKQITNEHLQDYKSNLEVAKNASVIEVFNSGVELFSEVYPDYKAEMGKIEPLLDKETISYILKQGKDLVGQQIAYYLAKNPNELELFKHFDADERKIELLNIKKKILKGEVKFTTPKTETKPQIKATPKASAQGIAQKDITQMTGAEYRAWKANGGLKNLR